MKRSLLALISILAGCATAPPGTTSLDVQMLGIAGEVDGRTIDSSMLGEATIVASRDGDVGTFFIDGPSLQLQLAACPLGSLATDPYGIGGGGSVDGSGRPVPSIADQTPGDGSTVTGASCEAAGLFVCSGPGCTAFAAQDLDLQIVEENGWRRVTADAVGDSGTAHVELLYRETP